VRRREHNWEGEEEVVDAGEHTAGKAAAAGRCVAGSSAVEARGSTRRWGARRRERDGGRECATVAAGSVLRRLFFSAKSRKTAGGDDEAAPVRTKKMRSFLFQGQNRNTVKNELVEPTCKLTEQ
jgi:hypothetical protein